MDGQFLPVTPERIAGQDRRQWDAGNLDPARSYRTPAQRDRDRVLYCSAFQRLAYVTQVTAPESGHAFHNRLSHSLKVAQVGRRNAERLSGLVDKGVITGAAADLVGTVDPDAVEASCLAHDLGHPPFGHIAERALNAQAQKMLDRNFDAFEGNAQSFRIVTRLAVRVGDPPGLDLTRRTLGGLLKYPWAYSPSPGTKANHKWGYYKDDQDAFEFVCPGDAETLSPLGKRTLEAEIMDWADDLTYAVHDLDDFFRAGLIPLHRLGDEKSPELEALQSKLEDVQAAEPTTFPNGHEPKDLVAATYDALSLYGPDVVYDHTTANRASMREFGSKLITRYLEGFKLSDDEQSGQVRLEIEPDRRCEVEALKMLVRIFVIRRSGLAVVQHGQERMIQSLFKRYFEASAEGESGDRRLFPPWSRERLAKANSETDRARVVVDLIAGLTEVGAVKLHQSLSGGWPSVRALDATADHG